MTCLLNPYDLHGETWLMCSGGSTFPIHGKIVIINRGLQGNRLSTVVSADFANLLKVEPVLNETQVTC